MDGYVPARAPDPTNVAIIGEEPRNGREWKAEYGTAVE